MEIELVEWGYGDTPATKAEEDKWVTGYYRMPRPGEAVRAYLEYAQTYALKKNVWQFATIQFSASFSPPSGKFSFKNSCTGILDVDGMPCTFKLKTGKLFEETGPCP